MDKLNEQLSALVDGELNAEETQLVLKRLKNDPEYASTLSRYQAISQAVGREPLVKVDLVSSISDAIALSEDDTVEYVDPAASSASKKSLSIFEKVAGVAIAASVAVVSIMVVNTLPEEDVSLQTIAHTEASGTHWQTSDATVANKLNAYLVKHNQTVVPALQGASNVRLVGYDAAPKAGQK